MADFDRTSAGASIIVPDSARTRELFDAIGEEKLSRYLHAYGDDAGTLKAPDEVR